MEKKSIEKIQTILAKMYQHLRCAICLNLLDTPVMTQCRHRFCSECVHNAIRVAPPNRNNNFHCRCPLCGQKLSKRSLVPQEHLQEVVTTLKMTIESFQNDTKLSITDAIVVFDLSNANNETIQISGNDENEKSSNNNDNTDDNDDTNDNDVNENNKSELPEDLRKDATFGGEEMDSLTDPFGGTTELLSDLELNEDDEQLIREVPDSYEGFAQYQNNQQSNIEDNGNVNTVNNEKELSNDDAKEDDDKEDDDKDDDKEDNAKEDDDKELDKEKSVCIRDNDNDNDDTELILNTEISKNVTQSEKKRKKKETTIEMVFNESPTKSWPFTPQKEETRDVLEKTRKGSLKGKVRASLNGNLEYIKSQEFVPFQKSSLTYSTHHASKALDEFDRIMNTVNSDMKLKPRFKDNNKKTPDTIETRDAPKPDDETIFDDFVVSDDSDSGFMKERKSKVNQNDYDNSNDKEKKSEIKKYKRIKKIDSSSSGDDDDDDDDDDDAYYKSKLIKNTHEKDDITKDKDTKLNEREKNNIQKESDIKLSDDDDDLLVSIYN